MTKWPGRQTAGERYDTEEDVSKTWYESSATRYRSTASSTGEQSRAASVGGKQHDATCASVSAPGSLTDTDWSDDPNCSVPGLNVWTQRHLVASELHSPTKSTEASMPDADHPRDGLHVPHRSVCQPRVRLYGRQERLRLPAGDSNVSHTTFPALEVV